MGRFAKIFNEGKDEEIVVLKGTDSEDRPSINILFEVPGVGMCETSVGYEDTAKGESFRDSAFLEVDKEGSESARNNVIENLLP